MNQLEQGGRAERAEKSQEAQEEDQEAKKMAARERVEVVSREVKTTKQQIQNIVGNMQMVLKAVAAIRAQLQAPAGGSIPSVEQDKKRLDGLQKKLDGLFGEIGDLKKALLVEERKAVGEEHKGWSAEEIQQEAEKRVGEILRKVGIGQ